MKLLLAHNFYGPAAPSGENTVFEAERDLLRARGHEVIELTRMSDDFRSRGVAGLLQGALATAWNHSSAYSIVISRERPDVVYAHDTLRFISSPVYSAVHV